MHHSKVNTAVGVRRRAGPLHSAGRATLADVAAAAGVSQMTVSRVINDGPVSQKTRRVVEQALEQLDYRPNEAARELAASRNRPGQERTTGTALVEGLWAPYGKFISEMCKPRS